MTFLPHPTESATLRSLTKIPLLPQTLCIGPLIQLGMGEPGYSVSKRYNRLFGDPVQVRLYDMVAEISETKLETWIIRAKTIVPTAKWKAHSRSDEVTHCFSNFPLERYAIKSASF